MSGQGVIPTLWPWAMSLTLDFRGQILKNHISGMGWPNDMERKGCEAIECWTHVVTFNVYLTHDLDLDFQGQIFKKLYIGMWGLLDIEQKGYESTGCYTYFCGLTAMTMTSDFQGEFLKKIFVVGMRGWIDKEKNGIWIDRMLDPCCDFEHQWPWPWIFNVKY